MNLQSLGLVIHAPRDLRVEAVPAVAPGSGEVGRAATWLMLKPRNSPRRVNSGGLVGEGSDVPEIKARRWRCLMKQSVAPAENYCGW